jgi:hypothetical protein
VVGVANDLWTIAEQDYPANGSPREQLRFLLGYAILAPSSHNTQPWRFRLSDQLVDILADRSRDLEIVDPDDRELTISCGAALFHLRLALRCFGFRETTAILPDPQQPDHLARVHVTPGGSASDEEQALLAAIPRRITNRAAYSADPVPRPVLDVVRDAAAAEGAWFRILETEEARTTAAGLIAEGDRQQWADPRFRRELASWMRPDHTSAHDGMPGYGFGLGELESVAAPLLIRTFDMGRGRAAKDEELAHGSPVLAVLGTSDDTAAAHLAAGQAVARVLLKLTTENLSASFLNQPNEVPALRARLAKTIDQPGWPQMLMRIGYGPAARHTPRRPVAEVLL